MTVFYFYCILQYRLCTVYAFFVSVTLFCRYIAGAMAYGRVTVLKLYQNSFPVHVFNLCRFAIVSFFVRCCRIFFLFMLICAKIN